MTTESRLKEYKGKRNFQKTSEPTGERIKDSNNKLIFVVQKHAASRLHYDFRLEVNGVLKSWAIPKGPSMNPKDKRLAMMVEDHPVEYKNFEGTIPEGNYGAGTVIVWDEGYYKSSETGPSSAKNINEREIKKGLAEGNLRIILNGKKLKGEFSLVKLKNKEKNTWLLIKKNDKYATMEDITEKDHSVKSDKTLEQVSKNSNNLSEKSPVDSNSKVKKKAS